VPALQEGGLVIVLLWMICGFAGMTFGLVLSGAWYGAAELFSFSTPTPDQIDGLILFSGSVGALGSAALTAALIIWDEIRS
jgi:hypothetical protein